MQRRSMFGLSVSAALVLAGSLPMPRASTPSALASDYVISYHKTQGQTGLAVMRADGSGITTLAGGAGTGFASCWSPDGQSIVFTHMDSSSNSHPGSTPVAVAVIDLAYTSRGRPSATNYRRLLTAGSVSSVAWSPDAREIAVAASQINSYGGPSGIALIPPVANAVLSVVFPVFAYHLAWNPDGDQLAFTNQANLGLLDLGTSSVSTLWSFGPGTTFVGGIDWGRTNDTLVFGIGTPTTPLQYEIHTLGLWPGASPQFVCNGRDPTWSPDDADICYHYTNWSMYVRTMATGATKSLKEHGNTPNWRRFS